MGQVNVPPPKAAEVKTKARRVGRRARFIWRKLGVGNKSGKEYRTKVSAIRAYCPLAVGLGCGLGRAGVSFVK